MTGYSNENHKDAILDVRSFLRIMYNYKSYEKKILPFLSFSEDCNKTEGENINIGLLDTSYDKHTPDLIGADIISKDFTNSLKQNCKIFEHGTYSVSILSGQGKFKYRGLVPSSRLFVANVVNSNGIATPLSVINALDWLINSNVHIIAIPLGQNSENKEISLQIRKGFDRGIIFFAAAGNGFPDPVVFPARNKEVIAVGAVDSTGNLLTECSRFPSINLVAPGFNIPALIKDQQIKRKRGTSVACVIAAGITTLMLSKGNIRKKELRRSTI